MTLRSGLVVLSIAAMASLGCAESGAPPSAEVDSQQDAFWWWGSSGYTETEYPIVLMHGFMGFDNLLGGIVQYWPGIVYALERSGAEVYVVESATANSSEVRGELIISQLEEIAAVTGHRKFNLIGHSQGGLDGRYIAAVRPDLVASMTSIGSPHKGSDLADLAVDGAIMELGEAAVELLANLLRTLGGAPGPIDVEAGLRALSAEGIAEFNANYPAALPRRRCGEGAREVNGVRYFSWGGTGVYTNALDVADPLWLVTTLFFDEANDGLVGRCSAHLGMVIRDNYFQNHLDEVNLLFGLVSPFTTNPTTVFRTHANRLKSIGL